jgi:hypothetical protein
MAAFLMGFLIAGLIGGTLLYKCYDKREIAEKKLRQKIANLEHNLEMIRRNSELQIERLKREPHRPRSKTKKPSTISTFSLEM